MPFLGGLTVATATDIFTFLTGAASVPALGFDHNRVIKFSKKLVLPTAQSCNFQLTLPTVHSGSKETMYENLTLGFLSHSYFGQA